MNYIQSVVGIERERNIALKIIGVSAIISTALFIAVVCTTPPVSSLLLAALVITVLVGVILPAIVKAIVLISQHFGVAKPQEEETTSTFSAFPSPSVEKSVRHVREAHDNLTEKEKEMIKLQIEAVELFYNSKARVEFLLPEEDKKDFISFLVRGVFAKIPKEKWKTEFKAGGIAQGLANGLYKDAYELFKQERAGSRQNPT